MSDVRTVKLKFSQLEFLDDNPRTIKEPRFKILSERIKADPTFFDNRPCLVNFIDGRYICYAGFQRAHAAAKALRWKEIPCSVENDVPMDLMRRRAIYDNTHDGEWNSEVLGRWEYTREELVEAGVPEYVFISSGDSDEFDTENGGGVGKAPINPTEARKTLAERFGIPPFSVFDTRQGYWQTRKRQWLALGIKSELGRGGNDVQRPRMAEGEIGQGSGVYGGGQSVKMAMHNDPKQRKAKYDGKG